MPQGLPDNAFPITLYIFHAPGTTAPGAEKIRRYFDSRKPWPATSATLAGEAPTWMCEALSNIRHETISTYRMPPDIHESNVIEAIEGWLRRLEQGQLTQDDMTQRLRNISTGIENLIGSLNAAIAEIQKLEGDVAERDLDIEQLRAQVAALQAELRRKKYSRKRILGIVTAIAAVVTALSTAALAVEGVLSHAAAPVNITNVLQDCNALRTTVESIPATVPGIARAEFGGEMRANIGTDTRAEISSDARVEAKEDRWAFDGTME